MCDQDHPLHGVVPGDHTRRHHYGKLNGKARRPRVRLEAEAAPRVIRTCAASEAGAASERERETAGSVVFSVNGVERRVEGDTDARTSLASYLRETLGLTGTKIGCGEGGCGAW